MPNPEGNFMPTIPQSHRDLAGAPLTGSLATIGADGTPQVTAVWYLADGDTIRLSVTSDRQKCRNMAARPRATLFVIDPANPWRTLEIRADVSLSEDADLALFKSVFRHYGADPEAGGVPLDGRIAVTLTPTRVVAQG